MGSKTNPSPETRQQPPESTELQILPKAVPPEQNARYAVTVRNAHMHYANIVELSLGRTASHIVLKGFNMTVERGKVYALLGASGCGKTTILRAIVGDHTLTSGKINVLGNVPKAQGSGVPGTMIGYMPQELSLLEELTIIENLFFYGSLAGMSTEQINAEAETYIELLDLPKKLRSVSKLSGGQRRRVSLTIALLNSPPVLVLDEPTVGMDSLLRENTWKHINKLAKEHGTTVIISTHYIEEARSADTIGLMRHGKLIAEQSPSSLLESLQCSDLEECLLRLCVHQTSVEQSKTEGLEDLSKVAKSGLFHHGTFEILGFRDISRLFCFCCTRSHQREQERQHIIREQRDYDGSAVFLCTLPTLVLILCCASTGGEPHGLYLSVVNQETNCSFDGLTSIENLRQERINRTRSTTCDMPSYFSCSMLKVLEDKEIFSIPCETEESAKELVRRGKSWGAVMFHQNFTVALLQRASLNSGIDEESLESSFVHLTLDQSDAVISVYLYTEMINALKHVLSHFDDECHTVKHIKDLPIQMKTPVYGSFSTTYRDFTMSSFIPGTFFMFGLSSSMVSFLPEKIRGVLERSVVSGVTSIENVVSHFVVQIVIVFLQDASALIVVFGLFELYNVGSFGTIALLSTAVAVSGIMLGFILALVCSRMSTACMAATGIFVCSLLASGGLWPIQAVATPTRQVMWMFPITAQTEAFRHVLLRGWTIANYSIQVALGVTLMYCILFICSFVVMYRHRQLFQNLI